MTKPAKEVIAQQEEVATLGVADSEVNDGRWVRDSALAFAITHHKHNGGMTTPQQLVDNANVFLNFLQGETK